MSGKTCTSLAHAHSFLLLSIRVTVAVILLIIPRHLVLIAFLGKTREEIVHFGGAEFLGLGGLPGLLCGVDLFLDDVPHGPEPDALVVRAAEQEAAVM